MAPVNKSAADVVVASTGEAIKTNANVRQSIIIGAGVLAGVGITVLVNKFLNRKDNDGDTAAEAV